MSTKSLFFAPALSVGASSATYSTDPRTPGPHISRTSLTLLGVLLLTSCATHPERPYRVGIEPSVPEMASATIWSDNTSTVSMYIKQIDGVNTRSMRDSAPPYAVTTSPGWHDVSVTLFDVEYMLGGARWADMVLSAQLEPGHSYALRHKTDGLGVSIHLEDLGVGQTCAYRVTGGINQGYTPVTLACAQGSAMSDIDQNGKAATPATGR